MRRAGGLWQHIRTFRALCQAAHIAARGHRSSTGTCSFLWHLEGEVLKLQRELDGGHYKPGPYRTFTIQDPKPRTISAAPFRDRVVHHALCAVLEPIFERVAIFDSYACRPGKGQHQAITRARQFARRHRFYLKLDIARYFETLDHDALRHQLHRLIKDPRTLDLIDLFLEAGAPGSPPGAGLPIGNLTSQHFANLHLAPLDHLILEESPASAYLRFMDDMILFSNSKEALWQSHAMINAWLRARHLTLKRHITTLAPVTEGLPFLGVRIWPALTRLNATSKRRFARKLTAAHRAHLSEEIDDQTFVEQVGALIASTSNADAVRLRRNLLERIMGEEGVRRNRPESRDPWR